MAAAAPYWVTNLVPLGIDPVSLGPFLYLNSLTGLSGTPDGTNLSLWPDESGNGFDATQGTADLRPTYRSSGAHISANGSPLVEFQGLSAGPGADTMGASVGTWPDVADGYDLMFYGRFFPAVNVFGGSILFQDQSGGAPQIGYESAAPDRKWFERDAGGTNQGSAFGGAVQYGFIRFKFVPATANTGTLTASFQATSALTVLTASYNIPIPPPFPVYILGGNVAQNLCPKMDLGACVWFDRVLSDFQASGIRQFWQAQFG